MDSSFSKALDLNQMSSSTTLVVWTMVIFLIALVVGILIFFKRQLDNKNSKKTQSPLKSKTGKGF